MRIDQMLQLQEHSKTAFKLKEPIVLKKGQVIKATVVAQEGNETLLRTEDGKLFSARMMTEQQLLVMDEVECMVTSQSSEGEVQLQLLEHHPAAAAEPLGREQAILQSLGLLHHTDANIIMQTFGEMGIRQNAELLLAALAMLETPALDAEAAAFFAANEMEPTPENVKAFLMLREGQTMGPVLYDVMLETAAEIPAERLRPQIRQEMPAAVQPQPQPDAEMPRTAMDPWRGTNAPLEGVPVPYRSTEAGVTQFPDAAPTGPQPAMENGVPVPDAASFVGDVPEAQPGQPQIMPTDAEQPGQPQAMPMDAAQPDIIPMAQETPAQPMDAAQRTDLPPTGAQAEQQALPGITGRLLSFFLDIDAPMDGAKVRQAANDTAQLGQLRRIMEGISVRRETLDKMGDIEAQAKLTQDINRFVCLHIPVHHQGYDTAELYIYKHKRKDKGIDPEDTSILIALSTEHMGRVETLVRVQKRNISLSFALENPAEIPALKEKTHLLYRAMKQHNYFLTDTKVTVLQERTTPQNAQQVLLKSAERPRVYFDQRI